MKQRGKRMRILLAAAVLVGVITGWTGMLQSQERVPIAQHELLSAEGGLARYENVQRILWIKTDDSTEMQFSYTAETSLVGPNKPLQIGDRLKVFYEVDGKTNRAMRVELVPK